MTWRAARALSVDSSRKNVFSPALGVQITCHHDTENGSSCPQLPNSPAESSLGGDVPNTENWRRTMMRALKSHEMPQCVIAQPWACLAAKTFTVSSVLKIRSDTSRLCLVADFVSHPVNHVLTVCVCPPKHYNVQAVRQVAKDLHISKTAAPPMGFRSSRNMGGWRRRQRNLFMLRRGFGEL